MQSASPSQPTTTQKTSRLFEQKNSWVSNQRLKSLYQDAVIPINSLFSTGTREFTADEYELWCAQAKKLTDLGCYSEALVIYEQVLAVRQDDCEAWILHGGVLTHLDCYAQALASFEKALEIQPNHQTAWIFRAMALHHLGRYQDAYASYDRALGRKRRSLFSKLIAFVSSKASSKL